MTERNQVIGWSVRLAGAIAAMMVSMTQSEAAVQQTPDDFVITLERTCSAECPRYTVSIDADGNIAYDGREFAFVLGHQTAKMSRSVAADLFETVERIGFLQLRNRYASVLQADGTERISPHAPYAVTTVTAQGRSKRIEAGFGTPQALRDLERQIDEAANTERWTRLNETTLRQLVEDRWTPSADERATLFRRAIEDDDVSVVKGLIAIGADPNATYFEGRATPLMFVRSAAMAQVLLKAGAVAATKGAEGGSPLGTATHLAPDVTKLLLEAGVAVDEAQGEDGATALYYAACVGNVGVVKLLLGAGANAFVCTAEMSAAECARHRRESSRSRELSFVYNPPLFVEDFDATIAMLEEATAGRRSKR